MIFHPLATNANPNHDVCTQVCDVDKDCPDNTFCNSDKFCIPLEVYCKYRKCSLYEGDCDNDFQCSGDLVCGSDNFIIRHPDVVVEEAFLDKDACESPGIKNIF